MIFQGQKHSLIILKSSGKRELFVIPKLSFELITDNINNITKKNVNSTARINKVYSVLSYRSIENQNFDFFNVAALWDDKECELLLKADDSSIPMLSVKKARLPMRIALTLAEDTLR